MKKGTYARWKSRSQLTLKQMSTTMATSHLSGKKQKKRMSLIKLEQCAGAEHHTSVFSPAEQSEGNEISRLGCGLSVIRFHRPSLSTAGSRSYKHAAMSAHHPACLSLLLALFLNFRFCVSLSGVLLCLFALNVTASEYNSVLPSIRR